MLRPEMMCNYSLTCFLIYFEQTGSGEQIEGQRLMHLKKNVRSASSNIMNKLYIKLYIKLNKNE